MDGVFVLIFAVLALMLLVGLCFLIWLSYRANKMHDDIQGDDSSIEETQHEEEL